MDETGKLFITFFNQSYVKDQLRPGKPTSFTAGGSSLLHKSLNNPVFEREDRAGTVTGRILPLYRLTAGVSNRMLAGAVEAGLDLCRDILPEILPETVRRQYGLAQAGFSLRTIHFPPDFAQLAIAGVGWCSRSCLFYPAPCACSGKTGNGFRACSLTGRIQRSFTPPSPSPLPEPNAGR